MKKSLTAIFALLLAVCLLAACGSESAETSSQGESSVVSEAESSVPEEISRVESSTGEDSEEEAPIPEDAVELLFARYTSNPSFVMIGTCAQGAEVTARIGEQEITVPSYMGWFAVTMKAEGDSNTQEITFTQTVEGEEYDIPRAFSIRVRTPANNYTQGLASNKAFQFFLTQMLPDHMGTAPLYNSTQLNGMASRVKDRLNQIHAYNPDAEIIYMIIPSPMTIYPELVPEEYPKGTGQSRRDQVMAKLAEAGATVIDMRETFMEHKHDEMPLYYHLDSHWADYGAYLAYVELFNHISEKYPEASPRGIDEFTWTADYYTSADAMLFLDIPQKDVKEYGYYREFKEKLPAQIAAVPRYRGMQLIYSEDTTEEFNFNTKRKELPSCMVFRDSYSAAIFDLIPERMNRTHYIGMWNYGWNNAYVNSEKPDYVIYILSEWNIDQVVSR